MLYRAGGSSAAKGPPPEELPPRPLGPSAPALLAWPAGSTSGFHFSLRSEMKQKNKQNERKQ